MVTRLKRNPRHQVIDLIALVLLALLPRLAYLGSAPPGLSGDEIFNALDALQIGWGNWPVFFEGNNGREPLFLYLMAASMRLLGESVVAIRLPAALLGTASVLLTYLIGRQQFSRRAGLVAAGLMAVSLWSVMLSHWALRAVSLTAGTALTVSLYGRAMESQRRRDWLLAGVALGLTLYTYIPARIFPLVIVGWFGWLAITQSERWRADGRRFLLSLLIALVVTLPLIGYGLRYPEKINQRVGAFETALDQARDGDPLPLMRTVVAVGRIFSFEGDGEWRYHVARQPIFDPLSSLFFYAGLVVSLGLLWRRNQAAAMLLLWFGVMLAPVLILEENVSFLRVAGAMVPIFLLAGVGFDTIAGWLQRRWPGAGWRLLPVIVAAGLLVALAGTWRDYFGLWRNHPEVRHIYQAELAEMARYLAENPPPADTRVFVGAKYVLDYTTPRAYDFVSDVPVTWFHQENSFAWQEVGQSWYLIPASQHLPAQALDWLSQMAMAESVLYDDGHPAFTLYRQGAERISWPGQYQADVAFVEGPHLVGFDLPAELYRGEVISIILHGEIPANQRALPNQLTYLQVLLEDASGNQWGSSEALLGYPQAGWRAGDRFAQQLSLEIPAGMPPGGLFLRFRLRDSEGRLYSTAGGDSRYGPFVVRSQPLADVALGPETPVYGGVLALTGSTFSSLFQPGLPIDIALTWVALSEPTEDYRIRLELRPPGASEPTVAQTFALWPDLYPASEWSANEPVTTLHRLAVPLELPLEADPELHLFVLPAEGSEPIPLTSGSTKLADMTVVRREHLFEAPPITAPLEEVRFGETIQLLGYDLDSAQVQAGGELALTLYWTAVAQPPENYTVFNHIAGADGMLHGQFDSPPVGDAWLMTTWLPGEIIVDRRTIPIRPDAPAGSYRLLVGLYNPNNGERVPVIVAGQRQPEDALLMTRVEVTP